MRKPLVRHWTDLERDLLRQMVEAGKSRVAIAARLKRSIPSINREAANLGLGLKARKSTFTPEDIEAQHRAFSSSHVAGDNEPSSGELD